MMPHSGHTEESPSMNSASADRFSRQTRYAPFGVKDESFGKCPSDSDGRRRWAVI